MNKMEVLEQIDKKINQEFKLYNVDYPLFLSCLPLINKIFLLNSTFKRGQDDENKIKIAEQELILHEVDVIVPPDKSVVSTFASGDI